jgi:hypothetical protein
MEKQLCWFASEWIKQTLTMIPIAGRTLELPGLVNYGHVLNFLGLVASAFSWLALSSTLVLSSILWKLSEAQVRSLYIYLLIGFSNK